VATSYFALTNVNRIDHFELFSQWVNLQPHDAFPTKLIARHCIVENPEAINDIEHGLIYFEGDFGGGRPLGLERFTISRAVSA
jgi:hypothetical protein